MPVVSPVSERMTVVCLLLLTFSTGIVDAVSVLVLGHVFVANMTGNVIFLGFWFAPRTVVDMTAALVAFVSFVAGAVLGGRLARHLDDDVRRWLTVALGIEVVVLVALSILTGTGVLDYHDNTKLFLIAGLAVTFGSQNATARQFGIQELSTTVLTSTIVGIGFDSRLAGGTGQREKLRYSVVLTMCAGAMVGATMTRWAVAPVIALAAAVVAVSAAIFRFGRQRREDRGLVSAYAISTRHRCRPWNRQVDRRAPVHPWLGRDRRGPQRTRRRGRHRAEPAAHLLGHPRRHRCRTHRRAQRVAARAAGRDRQQRRCYGQRADGGGQPLMNGESSWRST